MAGDYDAAFVAFLLFTNQKPELCAEIAKRIRGRGATSLLDIGAGAGELAVPLSSLVRRYCAVEHKGIYAALLRARGLHVIESSFPVAIDSLFDFVLISHVLPRQPVEYEPFLQSAWSVVAPGGALLGVLHNDVPSEWYDLITACGLSPGRRASSLEKLSSYFSTLGPTTVDTITTTVSTASRRGIVSALSFVYGAGKREKIREFEERSSLILQYLDARYRNGEEYCFPFHHIFLQAHKER